MNTLNTFLISTLILAGLSLNLAEAAAPPGKAVTPSVALQGASGSTVKWAAPLTSANKVHVFVPNTGKVSNALYRVYPQGKRAGDSPCSGTDPLYPCFEVTIDQTQHKNAWVQLTLNGDPETQWVFTKTQGYVEAVTDNLDSQTLLNVSTKIRFENMTIAIGNTYQGGIIFYIDGSGAHGLVAAPKDQSTGIIWGGCTDADTCIETGATATAVGKGKSNTNKIIAAQGAGDYAAALAANLVLNGYSDWFLPSRDELHLMYIRIGPGAPAPLTNIGGFSRSEYWSSSEYDFSKAWGKYFPPDEHRIVFFYGPKNTACSVRAVRAF